ncbi:hypothetical protein [Bradyrhizobium sp. NAS80.1]|uniref:hypothetical protein n=1 Tax=Bradyrhizobium sp. NAS80.1 TaxID=1680159 RepID=UPI001FDA7495|nr:hypothetical protein [Bradyrhizobium sp. NAS80.1]
MQVVGLHLVMRRHEVGEHKVIAKAWRWTTAPGKSCGRRKDAEQIGEGDKPPHPDPHRSRQLQQHSADMLFARGNVARADCNLIAKRRFAKLFLPQCTAHAHYRGTMLDRAAISEHGPARARTKSSRTETGLLHP